MKINPTRTEFLKLRHRLAIATRGHKLLKNKYEGLMKEFLLLVREYNKIRQTVDTDLPECIKLFILARITSSSQATMTALEQSKGKLKLEISERHILNINVPVFKVRITENTSYSLIETSAELDKAIAQLKHLFASIIRVAELEQAIFLLIEEIEKTRRRVNALEYVIIPQIHNTIKIIKNRFDETERSNINRLLKIKEMLISKK